MYPSVDWRKKSRFEEGQDGGLSAKHGVESGHGQRPSEVSLEALRVCLPDAAVKAIWAKKAIAVPTPGKSVSC